MSPREDEEKQQPTNRLPLSYKNAASISIRSTFELLGTFTFSAHLTLLAILASRFGSEDTEEDYLGATVLVTTFLNFAAVLAMSSLFAQSTRVATHLGRMEKAGLEGQGHKKQVSSALKRVAVLAIPLGLIPVVPFILSKQIFQGLGQPSASAALAADYLKIASFAAPLVVSRLAAEQTLVGFNEQRVAMKNALLSFVIGTSIAYVLGFGKGGAPRLEFKGVATGLVIQEALALVLDGLALHMHPKFKEYKFFKDFLKPLSQDDWNEIKELLKLGLPITLTLFSELTASFLLALFAGLLSKEAIAAYNFSSQFATGTTLVSYAFGLTAMPLVSNAIAKNEIVNAQKLIQTGLLSSACIVGPPCIIAMTRPEWIASIFANSKDLDDDVRKTAYQLLRISGAGVFADTFRYYMLQILRVLNDGEKATLIANVGVWLGLFAGYALGNYTQLEVLGIAAGYEMIALAGAALPLVPRFLERMQPAYMQNLHNENARLIDSSPALSKDDREKTHLLEVN